MENTIDTLQRLLALDVNAIVRLVVVLQLAAAQNIFALLHARQRQLRQPRKVHFLDRDPIGANGNGSVPDFNLRLKKRG